MTPFETLARRRATTVVAPDGSAVMPLLGLAGGSMAEFELAPGQTSAAMTHRTVDEIWYVLRGRGEIWRRQGTHEEVAPLEPGVCLTIPLGTTFQFRVYSPDEPLQVVAVTMPPWPAGSEEEARPAQGCWTPVLRH